MIRRWPRRAAFLFALLGAVSPAAADGLQWRASLDWYNSIQLTLPAQGLANPHNTILRAPLYVAESELRPNLRFEYETFQLTVRPSLAVAASETRIADAWHGPDLSIRAIMVELYGSWRVADYLTLAYGLQNFQWGPADTISPSNPLFHLPFTRNILTLIRGRHLVRANFSFSRSWSLILLLEPTDNGEPSFVAGAPFERKGLIKLEYSSRAGDSYVGIVGGKGESFSTWVGEYAVYSFTDSLSLYADVRHQRGSNALYPTGAFLIGSTFLPTLQNSDHFFTVAVLGARYQFKGGWDARLEYFYNEPGYDATQLALATQSMARLGHSDPSLVAAYLSPGLDLPGRMYAYASLRRAQFGPRDSLTLDLRYVFSLTDYTGAAFFNGEWLATDSFVLFLSVSASHGKTDGDLTRLGQAFFLLGGRYSW